MRQSVSRRSFLVASAGLVAAAACGGGGKDDVNVDPSDTSDTSAGPNDMSLVVASYVHVAGIDERVTVTTIRRTGYAKTNGPAEISIDGKPVQATLHSDGIALPYYLIRHRFETAGIHDITAKVDGKTLTTPIEVGEAAAAKLPIPGRPLIRVATPTVADAKGVNPICTRQPACPLHDVSLDAALDEKRPIAVLFSTPALCQSQLCGPVLEELLSMRDEFGAKVRMVHAEIFTDLSGKTLTPAVKAFSLDSEPFLFLAGADGIVRDRLDNAYDKVELRAALTRLVA